MKRPILSIGMCFLMLALAFGFAALSGCSTANVKDLLGNLERDCVRHYSGGVSNNGPVGAATITFTIDCQPIGLVKPGVVEVPVVLVPVTPPK